MTTTLSENETRDLLVALGNTDIPARSWEPDGDGVCWEGVVGGDGAGEAVSVRYLNRYAPNAQVTVYFFVVDQRDTGRVDEDAERPFVVESYTEFYVTDRPVTDPDAQEVWVDSKWVTYGRAFEDEGEAQMCRDTLASAHTPEGLIWDGTPGRV